MDFFQTLERAFHGCFLICRNLVAELVELLLGLEDYSVGMVEFVGALFGFLVGLFVGLCLVAHALDLSVAESAGSLDTDRLFLAGCFVLCSYVENTVGIYFESHLDLRHAARCGCDTAEVELAEEFVVGCHGAFALKHTDGHFRLVVGRCGECLALARRDSCVGVDEFRHHSTHGLDTDRQRNDVEQKHILNVTAEDAALDSRSDSHNLVGIHTLVGFFAENLFYLILDSGDTCGATHQNHLVDLRSGKAGIL